MISLGYDIGSSFIKGTALDLTSGDELANVQSPHTEMPINAPEKDWAEQDPDMWWEHFSKVTRLLLSHSNVDASTVKSIGISYQMHGLVAIDKQKKPVRPAVIWCDSRASEMGRKARKDIGFEKISKSILNSPGNFTASKLKWVKEYEKEHFQRIYKFMLPGDYIAMKLTGEISTTPSGLSEGILWDFEYNQPANFVLDYLGLDPSLLPDVIPNFTGELIILPDIANELGLTEDVKISYRAGDQANNAFALNVLKPGELAANAGTSGVFFGLSEKKIFDKKWRINTFLHVNHTAEKSRHAALMCINGTGIQYSWIKNQLASGWNYEQLNHLAEQVSAGADGLKVFPFGNGAERVLQNLSPGASIRNLDFNRHELKHLIRAALEGIVFSMNYGLDIMKEIGMDFSVIRAGHANLFLNPLFGEILSSLTGLPIELYNTHGAKGAAIAAASATKTIKAEEFLSTMEVRRKIEPDGQIRSRYRELYQQWKDILENEIIKKNYSI